jgi:hypothetical protein
MGDVCRVRLVPAGASLLRAHWVAVVSADRPVPAVWPPTATQSPRLNHSRAPAGGATPAAAGGGEGAAEAGGGAAAYFMIRTEAVTEIPLRFR